MRPSLALAIAYTLIDILTLPRIVFPQVSDPLASAHEILSAQSSVMIESTRYLLQGLVYIPIDTSADKSESKDHMYIHVRIVESNNQPVLQSLDATHIWLIEGANVLWDGPLLPDTTTHMPCELLKLSRSTSSSALMGRSFIDIVVLVVHHNARYLLRANGQRIYRTA